MLLEAKAEGEEVAYALLGVGVNVAWAPKGAAFLREFGPFSRREVLEGFLLKLEALLPSWKPPRPFSSATARPPTPWAAPCGCARRWA